MSRKTEIRKRMSFSPIGTSVGWKACITCGMWVQSYWLYCSWRGRICGGSAANGKCGLGEIVMKEDCYCSLPTRVMIGPEDRKVKRLLAVVLMQRV